MRSRPDAWTPEEDAILREGIAEGRALAAIGHELGRSEGAVEHRRSVLRLQRAKTVRTRVYTDHRWAKMLMRRWA